MHEHKTSPTFVFNLNIPRSALYYKSKMGCEQHVNLKIYVNLPTCQEFLSRVVLLYFSIVFLRHLFVLFKFAVLFVFVIFYSLIPMQLEEQLSRLQREKNDLQSRMEEDQEDMNELMKKHKAAVAQVTLSSTHACQRDVQSLSLIITHTEQMCLYLYI